MKIRVYETVIEADARELRWGRCWGGEKREADALEDFVIAMKRDAIHAYEWTGKSGEWNARIFERERFAQAIEDAPTIIQADKEG